jgi:hypothetical protein
MRTAGAYPSPSEKSGRGGIFRKFECPSVFLARWAPRGRVACEQTSQTGASTRRFCKFLTRTVSQVSQDLYSAGQSGLTGRVRDDYLPASQQALPIQSSAFISLGLHEGAPVSQVKKSLVLMRPTGRHLLHVERLEASDEERPVIRR